MVRNAAAWTADLLGLLALVALSYAAVVEFGVESTLVRVALLAPLLLVGPGYALVAALYPECRAEGPTEPAAGTAAVVSTPSPRSLPPTAAGRVALSIAASLAIVSGLALGAAHTTGLDATRVLVSASAVTGGFALLALARRANLDPAERFTVGAFGLGVPFRRRTPGIGRANTGGTRAANVVLALGVLALVAATAFAASAAPAGEEFTEFYLVTPDENGTFTADDYPREFPADAGQPVVARVANHEGEATTYTVVALVQRVEPGADGGVSVTDEAELARFEQRVPAGETVSVEHRPDPGLSGDDLRLAYLLYEGDPPADPSVESAYRAVHYGVTVDGGA